MKTKISHLGRSTVSVILAVMMLLSTMLIGTVSTVNAVTKKFNSVNLVGDINGNYNWDSAEYPFTFDETTGVWYLDITFTKKSVFKARVNNDWTISFGDSNGNDCVISDNEIGDYTISIMDDSSDKAPLKVVKKTVKKVADSVTLTANPKSVKVGNSVTLTPTVSSPKSDNLTYTYNKISGGTATEVKNADNSLAVTPTVADTYKYTVTVSADGYSPVTSLEVSFTVTDSVKYYICGRFNDKWHKPSLDKDPQFVEDESNPGLFYYETGETIADLSGTILETYGDTPKYFYIYKKASNESTNYLTTSENAGHNFQNNTIDSPLALSSKTGTEQKYLVRFNNDKDTSTTPVTIWLDTRNNENNEYKLWYTTALPHTVTVANGVSSATVDKKTATAGETVTVTATPGAGQVLESVTVVSTADNKPVTTELSGNTATFTMPSQDVTVKEVKFRTAEKYTVTFSPNDATYGEVTAKYNETDFATGNTVTEGDTVTFTANPNEGYTFTGWTVTVNGTPKTYTESSLSLKITADTTVVANFKEATGTLSGYYLLCGEDATFQKGKYTPVPLYTSEEGVYYADFDAANITKKKDYYIIFSTKEDTSGIIVETNNVTINTVDNNGFSLSDHNENVQKPNGGSNNVKFAKVYINSDDVTGFTIKIIGLDLNSKKITYSAEPKFDVAPADTVEITAKDGTIRAGFTNTGGKKTTAVLGDTELSITTPDNKIIKASDSYETDGKNQYRAVTAKKVPNGSTVTVKTTIDPTATFAGHNGSDYYVKGFSVNGIFGGVLSQTEGKNHSSDEYTYTFTVDQEIYGSKLEITPVYFLKDDANCVYFYIENYDSAKQIWGNTPSCYVYYGSGTTTLEALGFYPGQPMVDYNGSIFTQIPKYIDNGGTRVDITGMTLNNYVWDDVHRDYSKKEQAGNAQTYDYDDFVKIADSGVNAENIIYRFKYNTFDNEPADTFAGSKADDAGWEVFLDYQNYPTDIFGNRIGDEKLDYKDTKSVTSSDKCLSIISNGYQKNYIGKYATEWSIYNKDGDRVATIPSSALLYALGKSDEQIKKAINLGTTPDDFLPGKEDRGKHWATFKTLYEKYKGFYAQINFEAAIQGGDDPGNRLDGRWYYTKSSQDITGEIKIQYANTLDDYNKVGGFQEDTFADDNPSSFVGKTTGASAYFTNPKDKVRKLNTTADNTQDYKFKVTATSTEAYTFVGWYRLIDGDYKAINPSNMSSLTGAVTQNSDVTLVARYIKTPGGSMTFQHSLYKGENAGGGKATTEIQVVVKNSKGEPLYDSDRIAGTASIDKDMITKLAVQRGLTVTVTLYTTTKNLYDFKGYYSAENTTVTEPFTDVFTKEVTGNRKEGLVTTSEYTFSFDEYYNKHKSTLIGDKAGTVYYNFYSDITSIKVPYKVQFSYTDRMGDQKYYNKAGYVDPENTTSYTIVEDTTNGVGVESRPVKVTLTDSFILSLAPYESNFTKNLTWDETPDSNTAFDSSNSKSIASAVVNSTQSGRTIHLNVFRDDNGIPTPRENKAGTFVLYEKGGSTELPYNSVFYKPNGDGTYTYDITAPKTYKDNGKELQFMYWAIYSDSECKNLVIKAYNIDGGFSYASYDNYWIVPVYGESSTPVASVKEVSTSTQFMEVTRNQWTADDTTDKFTGFDADSMATLETADDFIKGNDEDKLYADFVLNFFYNGKQLSVFDPNSEKVQTGIVMQKLELEKDSTGVGYNTDMKHYADKYTDTELSAAAEDAKNKILKKGTTIESLTKQIDNSRLSNKNRIQYYARFNNTEANANCVYRVYTYIKYVNESNETIIELGEPIYFTLYDVANKTV